MPLDRKPNSVPSGSKRPAFDYSKDREEQTGTSIFDPVLCELMYTWFCPANGAVLDPFAGGSVRGIVAGKLGLKYTGIELRGEQVDSNIAQAEEIQTPAKPIWIVGDSRQVLTKFNQPQFDFIFSCPPYGDLEVYSHEPGDLSNMEHAEFLIAYADIIKQSYAALKDDAFACFVVGDYRDKEGNYRNFVGDTCRLFIDAGFKLYNEAILLTSIGSLPVRAGKIFKSSRKLGKTHQNVLVFVKGNGKQAAVKCPEVYLPTELMGEEINGQ